MIARAIVIALDKASPAESGALQEVLRLAQALDEVETGFEAKINASKARRSEGPTKLPKARRAQVEGYAADAAEMERQQQVELAAMPCARDVIEVLHYGLQSDVAFWKSAPRHAHPDDVPVVQELVDAKVRLHAAMARYLAEADGG